MQITNFQGTMPRTPDKKLSNNIGITAQNCDTSDGQLNPYKDVSLVESVVKAGAIKSSFRCNDIWLSWLNIVDIVKAEGIKTDSRIYYTGDGYPKMTYKALAITQGIASDYPTAYRLGVESPAVALTVTTSEIASGEAYGDDYLTVSYTYTYISFISDSYTEESAPAPPTPAYNISDNMKVTLTGFVDPAGAGNNVIYYRVYRTAVTSSGIVEEFQLVPYGRDSSGAYIYDIPVAVTSFVDLDEDSDPKTLYQDLSEAISTEGWDNLPDTATGLTQYQNGILAAIYDQSVLISKAFYPYAFPRGINDSSIDYSYDFEYYPRHLASYRDMLIVGTDANPYILTGSDPEFLNKSKLAFNEACVGPMLVTEIGAIYPSTDGLVLCDGITVAPMTTDTFSKEHWQALGPEDLKMFYYKNKILGFFKGSGTGFSYDFKQTKTIETTLLSNGLLFYDGHLIEEDGKLFLLVSDSSSSNYSIYQWEGSSSIVDQTWEGYIHERDAALFSLVRVDGDFSSNKSLVLTLTVDEVVLTTITIENDNPYWLPSGYRFKDLKYKFVGKTIVDSIYFGYSRNDLYEGMDR